MESHSLYQVFALARYGKPFLQSGFTLNWVCYCNIFNEAVSGSEMTTQEIRRSQGFDLASDKLGNQWWHFVFRETRCHLFLEVMVTHDIID